MRPSPQSLIAVGIALGAIAGGIGDAESPGIDGARVAMAVHTLFGSDAGEKIIAALGIVGWVVAGIGWLQLRSTDRKPTAA